MGAVQKPSIPKGTRDFSPLEMARRNYIFDTVREVFKKYGYKPIETPAMENLSTLLGKYGDEGDKLLFKILNSGSAFGGVEAQELANSNALSLKVCEKGLRYDLTVPFARYVVQHRNEISFPFKRYQIQPVWRADRPQKGRYREFYQCDIDVIGSNSLLNEVELLQIVNDVFQKFEIDVVIKINNRKILTALANKMGYPEKIIDITVAIDKIDKIGLEAVVKELIEVGIGEDGIKVLKPILECSANSEDKISLISSVVADDPIGKLGVEELKFLYDYAKRCNIEHKVEIDLSLARGLNYYTGAIFEVKAKDFAIGSICGGGRYDNLTGIFGFPEVSGVGISFGADRIYDVLLGLDKFPSSAIEGTSILISNMDSSAIGYSLLIASKIRSYGYSCEVYPDTVKLKKQFEYAQKNAIPYFVIIGEDELKTDSLTIKNLDSGEQKRVSTADLENFLGEIFA